MFSHENCEVYNVVLFHLYMNIIYIFNTNKKHENFKYPFINLIYIDFLVQ